MTLINAFKTIKPTFDSAKVSARVYLGRKITKKGLYLCKVVNALQESRVLKILVESTSSSTQSTVNCDELFDMDPPNQEIKIGVEDYLLFVSIKSDGEYSIVITQAEDVTHVIFESDKVGIDGFIVLNPLLPASYTVTNLHTGVTAQLKVTPLEDYFENAMSVDAIDFYESIRAEGALQVSVSNTSFSPDPIDLIADRPAVLMGDGPLRIVGELIELHPLGKLNT